MEIFLGPAGGGAERREEPGGGRHEERLRTTDARGQTLCSDVISSFLAEPHYFNADPDTAFYFNADPIPAGLSLSLQASIVSVHRSSPIMSRPR